MIGVASYGALGHVPPELAHIHQFGNFCILTVGLNSGIHSMNTFMFQFSGSVQFSRLLYLRRFFVCLLLDFVNMHVMKHASPGSKSWRRLLCSLTSFATARFAPMLAANMQDSRGFKVYS